MAKVHELARFIVERTFDDLSPAAKSDLKIRVLDALGEFMKALSG
jgi:hypothetical protein